jgi:hypothetical protein
MRMGEPSSRSDPAIAMMIVPGQVDSKYGDTLNPQSIIAEWIACSS